jgi:subtilisin family serine protease
MLFEGVSAALGQRPDVLLVGLGSINPLSPDVETLLTERQGEVFIVAPAGNEGAHDAHWPASLAGVAGVAAMTSAGERAAFSNYGSSVDLAAPGVDVNSLNGIDATGRLEFGLLSGTSPAADLVAGVAALLLATRRVPPSQLRATLVQTSRPPGADSLREIDADAAVEALLEGGGDG